MWNKIRWIAAVFCGLFFFMSEVSYKDASSNLSSWAEAAQIDWLAQNLQNPSIDKWVAAMAFVAGALLVTSQWWWPRLVALVAEGTTRGGDSGYGTPIYSAMQYLRTGDWKRPIVNKDELEERRKEVAGAKREICQAARLGKIQIFGASDGSPEIYEPIEAEFWGKNRIGFDDFDSQDGVHIECSTVPANSKEPQKTYWRLRVDRRSVERVWPRSWIRKLCQKVSTTA